MPRNISRPCQNLNIDQYREKYFLLSVPTLEPVASHEASSDDGGVRHHHQTAEGQEEHNEGVFVAKISFSLRWVSLQYDYPL